MSYRKSSYSNDPKWIDAKFNSTCFGCKMPIAKNEQCFYYPLDKTVYCSDCGISQSDEFSSAREDEDFMNSQFPSYG